MSFIDLNGSDMTNILLERFQSNNNNHTSPHLITSKVANRIQPEGTGCPKGPSFSGMSEPVRSWPQHCDHRARPTLRFKSDRKPG